jgi:hypothetical protein
VLCDERERLTILYLAAVTRIGKAAGTVTDLKSEAWREATKETREDCDRALSDLKAHRKEHGC